MKIRNYLLSLLLILSVLPSYSSSKVPASPPSEFYMLVGTYTSGKSEGIYVYKFNSKTGDLTYVSKATGLKNPAFLSFSPNQKYVYSVGETDKNGSVNAFSFDKKNGKLTFLNSQPSNGSGPCHVTTDLTGKWVIVGNYSGGSLSVLPVEKDGKLGAGIQTIQHEGKSVNAQRQEKPHVHSINIAPNNTDVFVPDLGIDKIVSYQLDAKTGHLSNGKPEYTTIKDGAGPRHFTFHPNGKFAYVINELDATVTAFHYKKGGLSEFQTISTLPKDYTGQKWCADIHISPDGKFLYGSNRTHDSLVIYSIDPKTGELAYITNESVLGKTPRNFAIDPTGNFILVANQDSDNITIFKRNKQTGTLTSTGKSVEVGTPVCLKLVPVE